MDTLDVSSSGWMMYVNDDLTVSASRFCNADSSYVDGQCIACPENYGTLFFNQAECMSCNEMVQYDLTGNMGMQTSVAKSICEDPYTKVVPPQSASESFFANFSTQPLWAQVIVGIALFTISVLAVAGPILIWCCLKKKKEAALKAEELKKKTLS